MVGVLCFVCNAKQKGFPQTKARLWGEILIVQQPKKEMKDPSLGTYFHGGGPFDLSSWVLLSVDCHQDLVTLNSPYFSAHYPHTSTRRKLLKEHTPARALPSLLAGAQ